MPSTATIIADKLGLNHIMAFDISAACTGFIYAMSVAKAYIESNMAKNVLIIGAEKLSNILDYSDRATCFLFGDGAGAAIISATNNPKEAIIDINCQSDGSQKEITDNLIFSSDDESVAKADSKGVVKALKEGFTTIHVEYNGNDKYEYYMSGMNWFEIKVNNTISGASGSTN